MIEWHHWQTLLFVARYGTLAGAAKALSVDATTIGRRIKWLEAELGIELFLREGTKLVPSSQCHNLLNHIETADDALKLVQYSAAGGKGNIWREVRITAPPFVMNNSLVPNVGELAEQHRIKISLLGVNSKALLSRREADIAIRIEDRPGEINSRSPRVKSVRIGTLRYAIYAPDGIKPEDAAWAGLLEPAVMTSGSRKMIELLAGEEFQFRANQFDSLREMIISGQAKAMIPRPIGDRDERLRCVSETVLEQPLWMVFHRQDLDIRHFRTAREWISQSIRNCGMEI